MHVNNGSLGAQCKVAVHMYKDCFRIAVPILKMYSKVHQKSYRLFIGFPKQGVHGWLKYTWYMIKYGSGHTYYSVKTSYSAHPSSVIMMSQ
jgi:hypothetical protein